MCEIGFIYEIYYFFPLLIGLSEYRIPYCFAFLHSSLIEVILNSRNHDLYIIFIKINIICFSWVIMLLLYCL
jgi:hypothetical protein